MGSLTFILPISAWYGEQTTRDFGLRLEFEAVALNSVVIDGIIDPTKTGFRCPIRLHVLPRDVP